MNVRKLRKLQRFLKKVPERFTMDMGLDKFEPGFFYTKREFMSEARLLKMPPCHTAGCLAGETLLMEDPKVSTDLGWITVQRRASEILDLTPSQARTLFYLPFYLPNMRGPEAWPKEFSEAYRIAKTPKERVRVAVEYIDFFIEEEKRKDAVRKRNTARLG